MSLAFPTTFPATLGISNDLVLNIQCIDPDGDRYEACLLTDGISPAAIAFGEGVDAPSSFLSLLGDENCDLGEGNFPAAAVLVLRDLAHEAVDLVCQRLSAEPLESVVFERAPAASDGFERCPECQFVLAKCGDGSFICDNCRMQKIYEDEGTS